MNKLPEAQDAPVVKEKIKQVVVLHKDTATLAINKDGGTQLMSERGDPGTERKPISPEPEKVKQTVKR